MKTSPCRLCAKKDEDKNNPTCVNCVQRLRYISSIGRSFRDPATATEENYILPSFGDGHDMAL